MRSAPRITRPWHRQGFSLVEMMVVIVIIAILMALAVFGTQFAWKKGARDKTKQQIKTLELGLEGYYNDYLEYPVSPSPNGGGTPDQPGSQDLYMALTGDRNMNGQLEDEEKTYGNYLPELMAVSSEGKSLQGWILKEGDTIMITDPFGEEYQYRAPGEENALYDIWSYGMDATKTVENEEKWITNW